MNAWPTVPARPLAGPASMPCPACAAELAPDQGWCLNCGSAARTRVAPAPRWHVPIVLAAVVIALSLAALGFAFVRLSDMGPVITTTVPAAAAPATPAPAPTTPAAVPNTPAASPAAPAATSGATPSSTVPATTPGVTIPTTTAGR